MCSCLSFVKAYLLRMRLDRPDLAAMLTPLARACTVAELPVLASHSLSMWGYAVLLALDEDEPVRSQAVLAQSIGADKTRIIGVLDELQENELITRTRAPEDRRVRLVSSTEKGRHLRDAVRAEIQRREARLLDRLPPGDREVFLKSLRTLSEVAREEIVGR